MKISNNFITAVSCDKYKQKVSKSIDKYIMSYKISGYTGVNIGYEYEEDYSKNIINFTIIAEIERI